MLIGISSFAATAAIVIPMILIVVIVGAFN
jgi:hypothetical protein